jgi:hypothetical protein
VRWIPPADDLVAQVEGDVEDPDGVPKKLEHNREERLR